MKTAGIKHVSTLSFAAMTAAAGLICATSLAPAPAAAQNHGTPEQQQACQPDAMRLCSEFVPDVDRITACMVKNRIRLSAPCRVYFVEPRKGKTFKRPQ